MTEITFTDLWEGGEKTKGIGTRRYRNVCVLTYTSDRVPEREEYIEVELNDGYIMKCDIENLNLIKRYRWSVYGREGRRAVQTATKVSKQVKTISFIKMVMGRHDGRISHMNKDSLDNRKCNLRLAKSKYRKDLDYVVDKVDIEKIAKSLESEDCTKWMGGKPGGSLNKNKDKGYIVRFCSPELNKCFSFFTYEDDALKEAEKFHMEEAERRGLVRNKHSIHMTPESKFLEVQCNGDKTFFCDMEDFPLVESRVWSIVKMTKSDDDVHHVICSNRAKSDLSSTSFHQALGLYETVDHIDGNPLNNRRCNLREGNKLNTRNAGKRKDNSSGVTGVSFSKCKNAWIVQWPEGGKRRQKYFYPNKYRTLEERKREAIEFRLEKDKELNLHQQQYI